ncbi:MAG: LamG domain-containing protein [Anaerohalosphaera sp.]|nr:LamG domain-containing protein [Anaerohalosphaera sp.]
MPNTIDPDPYNGRLDVSSSTTLLDWDVFNATNPVTCDIYFGTDSADQTWLETTTGLTDSQYTLQTVTLQNDIKYYWRVDVHEQGDPNTFTGTLWSFDTELSLPQITSQPNDVLGAPGETVQFDIEAIDPLGVGLNYQWYKGQAPDTSSPVGDNSPVLAVGPLAEADFNTSYYCAVSNSKGAENSQSGTILEKKLLAHWPLDDIADPNSIVPGSPATDTWGDPENVAGVIGQAMYFDGDDGLYSDPNHESYFDPMYENCTVSCWVKATTSTAGWTPMVSRYGDGGQGWQLRRYSSSDKPTFTTRGAGNDDASASSVFLDDQWHHIVGTFDGKEKEIYVDGILDTTVVVSGKMNSVVSSPIGIASRLWQDGNGDDYIGGFFTGAIDDVRLYNYAMDKIVIAQVYADVSGETICPEYPTADLDLDCDVDLEDFAILAANWLTDNTVLPQ